MAKESIASNPEKVKFLFKPSEARKVELKRTYDRIIENARGREKIKFEHERHHILPRSLGGSDSDDNCVNLTYKEHYLAHWILTRITEEPHRYKMLRAFFFMSLSCGGTRKVGGWQYALSKKAASEAQVGKTPAKGHKHTPEWRKQKSLYLMGNDHAKGKNLGNNGSRGHTWTLSQVKRENIRVRMLGKQQALNYIWKEEQVEKISGENHHSAKSVKCLNDNKIYPTQTSAARNYGLYQADVSVSCRLNKTVKGFRFEFT